MVVNLMRTKTNIALFKMTCFYEPLIQAGECHFILSEASSKHCVQVLRMQMGDPLQITNGLGYIFTGTLQSANKKQASVQIKNEQFIPAPSQKLVLGISLLKNAVRLEWLFEKATELGVTQIIPLICERTIHERFKMERMQNILQSAMIQSHQSWLPILNEPIAFENTIAQFHAANKYIAHCETATKTNIKALPPSNDCIILIGPEGDFSPSEISFAIQNQYQAIQLGPTRLRTETAGLFALSILKTF